MNFIQFLEVYLDKAVWEANHGRLKLVWTRGWSAWNQSGRVMGDGPGRPEEHHGCGRVPCELRKQIVEQII